MLLHLGAKKPYSCKSIENRVIKGIWWRYASYFTPLLATGVGRPLDRAVFTLTARKQIAFVLQQIELDFCLAESIILDVYPSNSQRLPISVNYLIKSSIHDGNGVFT